MTATVARSEVGNRKKIIFMSWIIAVCIIFVLMLLNAIFHPFEQKKGYKLLFVQGAEGLENKPCEIRVEDSDIWLDIESRTYQIRMKNVEILKQITEEDKSVVGRALVGGLVFGVVGAVVGGMSGIGTKEHKDYCLKITTESYELFFKHIEGYEFDLGSCYLKLKNMLPEATPPETDYL